MSAVELRLSQNDLSREMGAMRVWLDLHRYEPSSFSCRGVDNGVLVSLEFKIAHQAHAFAEHFGGRADGPSMTGVAPELTPATLYAGVSASGIIG
ncbi:MAG TPA: hypothetical protein VKF83_01955 [Stellaceae bacterium]|nr:hypothetical protein [Stellaceae bacterium]